MLECAAALALDHLETLTADELILVASEQIIAADSLITRLNLGTIADVAFEQYRASRELGSLQEEEAYVEAWAKISAELEGNHALPRPPRWQ